MKVLIPMNIDRWTRSIATQFRAVVIANPHIQFFSFSSPLTEEDDRKGVEFWGLNNIRKIRPLDVFFIRFDIVQVGAFSSKILIACLLAKLRSFFRCKVVNTLCVEIGPEVAHHYKDFKKGAWIVDVFNSVSFAAGGRARKDYPHKYAGVIFNGYDAEFFKREHLSKERYHSLLEGRKEYSYFLWVGNFTARKKPDFLIEIAQKFPMLQFVCAGEVGEYDYDIWMNQIKDIPNIYCMGNLCKEDLRELYGNAAALFFPSEREGLALSVIESLGMGTPVLGQPKTSMPEIIDEDSRGCLLDLDDMNGWRERMQNYLEIPDEERFKVQEQASNTIARLYDWNSAGIKYGQFYELVSKGKSSEWLQRGDFTKNKTKRE